jgi:hypothetical protein
MNCDTSFMEWFDSIVSLTYPRGLSHKNMDDIKGSLFIAQEYDLLGKD